MSALQNLAQWGVGGIVVHRGTEGAGYFADGRLITAPAASAKKRMMATGTGDVLSICMALLHHRQDLGVLEKLELANQIVAEFIEGRRRLIPELE